MVDQPTTFHFLPVQGILWSFGPLAALWNSSLLVGLCFVCLMHVQVCVHVGDEHTILLMVTHYYKDLQVAAKAVKKITAGKHGC